MVLIATLAVLFITFQNLDCYHKPNYGRRLSPRLNFFDIELLRASAEDKKGNVMLSPASVKFTLAMILAGAEGDTAKEIEYALRVSSLQEDFKEQYHLYLSALRANTTSSVFQTSNGIFVSKKLKVLPKYEAVVKLDYFSEVTRLNFSDPKSAAMVINNWVSESTHGLIPFVVEPAQINPLTDLVLANALYFKSAWLNAFDPRDTEKNCFYLNGDCKMVPMMNMEMELNYAHVEDLRAHALELPYEGKRYSMIIIVPLARDGLGALIRDLPYVSLPEILDLMHPEDVLLSMPKFTVNYNEDLVETLRKLHITCLFSNKSKLSKIFEGSDTYVNSFQHKVFMSVDETGTVAAASSSAMPVPLIFNGEIQVIVDRPFLFFIRDNELGVVLFEGKIEEPSVLMEQAPNGQVPIKSRVVENQKVVYPVQSSNPRPKVKSNTFVENLRNFFG